MCQRLILLKNCRRGLNSSPLIHTLTSSSETWDASAHDTSSAVNSDIFASARISPVSQAQASAMLRKHWTTTADVRNSGLPVMPLKI